MARWKPDERVAAVVEDLALIVLNENPLMNEIREEIMDGILDSSGYDDPADVIDAYRADPHAFTWISVAGVYARDKVRDALGLEEASQPDASLLLRVTDEILSAHDSALWQAFANDVMPTQEDLETRLSERSGDDDDDEDAPTYEIVRYYRDDRPAKVVQRGLTLEEARAHCNRADTHGRSWFDGYTEEES